MHDADKNAPRDATSEHRGEAPARPVRTTWGLRRHADKKRKPVAPAARRPARPAKAAPRQSSAHQKHDTPGAPRPRAQAAAHVPDDRGLHSAALSTAVAALFTDAERRFGPSDTAVRNLSRWFTSERAERPANYLSKPAIRKAYLGEYTPLYAAKIATLLAQLSREGHLPPAPEGGRRVLDLGAGGLAGVLGTALHDGQLGPSAAVDLAPAGMRDALPLVQGVLARAAGHTDGEEVENAADVSAPHVELRSGNLLGELGAYWSREDAPDLVVMAHVLNELGDARRGVAQRARLVKALVARLKTGARLLIMEPGTRMASGALSAVRDALVQTGDAAVLAPCMGAPTCPMQAGGRDWCHAALDWPRPKSRARIDARLGFKRERLSVSYLLLAKPGDGAAPRELRVIGGVMQAGATMRRYACGEAGLVTLKTTHAGAQKRLAAYGRGAAIEGPGARVERVNGRDGAGHKRGGRGRRR